MQTARAWLGAPDYVQDPACPPIPPRPKYQHRATWRGTGKIGAWPKSETPVFHTGRFLSWKQMLTSASICCSLHTFATQFKGQDMRIECCCTCRFFVKAICQKHPAIRSTTVDPGLFRCGEWDAALSHPAIRRGMLAGLLRLAACAVLLAGLYYAYSLPLKYCALLYAGALIGFIVERLSKSH